MQHETLDVTDNARASFAFADEVDRIVAALREVAAQILRALRGDPPSVRLPALPLAQLIDERARDGWRVVSVFPLDGRVLALFERAAPADGESPAESARTPPP